MAYTFAELIDQVQQPCVGEIRRGDKIGSSQRFSNFVFASCEGCGKERWVRFRHGKPEFRKCLSCSHIGIQRGENHPSWKGGRHYLDGYIRVHTPNHHRGGLRGYVFEHILVWERVHNRQLPDGWVIHHLNGIRDDNRPENLVALKKGKHIHLEERFKKRIRALEIKIELLEKALDANQLIYRLEEN